jgi:hypothetical protein
VHCKEEEQYIKDIRIIIANTVLSVPLGIQVYTYILPFPSHPNSSNHLAGNCFISTLLFISSLILYFPLCSALLSLFVLV